MRITEKRPQCALLSVVLSYFAFSQLFSVADLSNEPSDSYPLFQLKKMRNVTVCCLLLTYFLATAIIENEAFVAIGGLPYPGPTRSMLSVS